MKFWAVTHKHTAYVEAETEVEAMENCADQVRDNAEADDCTAEEISEHEYEQHWALIENGTHVKKKRTRRVSVPSPALLAETITALADSFDRDLFSQTKEQLEERWFFAFDASKSVEANIYSFHDMLKLYGGFCRRWEEHTTGRAAWLSACATNTYGRRSSGLLTTCGP